MIEGGGLGVYHPADVGPVSFQSPNGVIDILVEDEEEATAAAQKYLSYFQGAVADWKAPDQRLLRRAIPENRLRVYDIRTVIDLLADEGSVLEIRRDFGVGMITAFIRIEGKPFGLIANNPKHLGGAIDAPAGDKAARFMQLCDAFDIPIVSLCDTPGFMVGPEAEKTAIVRHVARMFVTGASLTVPLFGIVLRKGYGLGAQSMIGGGFHASFFTVAWPTGEFGGMGLEGYVRLGFRKEMEAIADPVERENYYKAKVAELYANGKAVSIASVLEIDEVIDPAETRHWIMCGPAIGAEAGAAQRPQAAVHRCVVEVAWYWAVIPRRPIATMPAESMLAIDGVRSPFWCLRLDDCFASRAMTKVRIVSPTGKSPKTCPSPLRKNIPLSPSGKSVATSSRASRAHKRGVGHRHERWARDAVDAKVATDERGLMRTAKSCGPDAPMLASSLREVIRRSDGGKKAVTGESSK